MSKRLSWRRIYRENCPWLPRIALWWLRCLQDCCRRTHRCRQTGGGLWKDCLKIQKFNNPGLDIFICSTQEAFKWNTLCLKFLNGAFEGQIKQKSYNEEIIFILHSSCQHCLNQQSWIFSLMFNTTDSVAYRYVLMKIKSQQVLIFELILGYGNLLLHPFYFRNKIINNY